jgi:hypothetical protein
MGKGTKCNYRAVVGPGVRHTLWPQTINQARKDKTTVTGNMQEKGK